MAKSPNWTEEEKMILLSNPFMPIKELMSYLPNRNYWAIFTKRIRLHIYRQAKTDLLNEALASLTDFDRGFLVGILEGEGFISISMGRGHRGRVGLSAHLGVEMTDDEVVERVKKLLKVGFVTKRKLYSDHLVNLHRYTVNDRVCIKAILEHLQPYFISPRKQHAVKLMIEFCGLRTRPNGKKRPPIPREVQILHEMKRTTLKGKPIKSAVYPELLLTAEATKQ